MKECNDNNWNKSKPKEKETQNLDIILNDRCKIRKMGNLKNMIKGMKN